MERLWTQSNVSKDSLVELRSSARVRTRKGQRVLGREREIQFPEKGWQCLVQVELKYQKFQIPTGM